MAKQRLAGPALAGIATLLALASGEVMARIVNPPPPPRRTGVGDPLHYRLSANPELVYELQPGTRVTLLETDRLVDYRINAHGMRGAEIAVPKPAGVFRLLAVGDSYTFGTEVAEEDTLPARLAVVLAERGRGEVSFEVLNGGVAGYNTHQELTWLKERGLALQPDLVLVNFTPNDILAPIPVWQMTRITQPVPLSPELFANPAHAVPAITPPAVAPVQDPKGWLKEHIRLYDLAALRWHQVLEARGLRSPAGPPPALPTAPEWMQPLNDYQSVEWRWLRQRYQAVRDLLSERGTPLVVWLALNSEEVGPNWAAMRGHFARFGAENGVPILDIAPLVRQQRDPRALYRPFGHLTGVGNQMVADAVLELLLDRRLLP